MNKRVTVKWADADNEEGVVTDMDEYLLFTVQFEEDATMLDLRRSDICSEEQWAVNRPAGAEVCHISIGQRLRKRQAPSKSLRYGHCRAWLNNM